MKTYLTILATLLLALHSQAGPATGSNEPANQGGVTAGIFTDHMVLQRDQPIPVWGYANPGEEITVNFAGQTKNARAGADGKWMVKLDPLPASADPHELIVECKARGLKSTFTDVLIGDVWLCSGQSNMWFPVVDVKNGTNEVAAANDSLLRFFGVAGAWTLDPQREIKSVTQGWQPCSPKSTERFSATAYFFGRELRRELGVPVGLIQSAWSGTPAEAWTRTEALKTVPTFAERVEKDLAKYHSQEADNTKFVTDRAAWEEKYGVKPVPVSAVARGWADPALETSDWKPVTLPAPWGTLGAKSGGVFWIRKEVTLPADAAGKPFDLSLSYAGEQYDTTYFNGVEVGRNPDKPPGFYNGGRTHRIPGNLVKEGRNVIAVRVTSATKSAQFGPPGYAMRLPVADKSRVDDRWLFKIETEFPSLPTEALATRPKPNDIAVQHVPGVLFNGMIAPLIPFGIRGVIWYQGEDNSGRPQEYRELLATLIGDWRAQWGQGEFPFLIQQLVNYGKPGEDPNKPGNWAAMREAQARVSETVPGSGLSVGIDIGETLNIHPKNKQDIGKRLALVALEKVYGKQIESSGPRYESMKIEGPAIRLSFFHAKGLHAKDGSPKGFAIAGADKKFVWADARIDGETVVVNSPQVPHPVAVRYAFAANPDGCNLYNAAGLPMAPFRTDDSKGIP